MKFGDWIAQQGLTQAEVGRQLGIRQGHVSEIVSGRFWPTRRIFAKIWRFTEGAVTPNDFLTEDERSETPKRRAGRQPTFDKTS